MAQELINVGAAANDRTGDTWRAAMVKVNDNNTELFTKVDAITTTFISQESDFPVQDATTITLELNQTYLITASFITTKVFICENNVSVTALNQFGVIITYTGPGDMFSGTDVNFNIDHIGLDCTGGGQYFNFIDVAVSNSHIFWCTNVIGTNCRKFGTFNNMASLVITDTAITTDASDGISVIGSNWRVCRIQNCGFITTSSTFVGVNLGAATLNAAAFGPLVFVGQGTPGAIGIAGLASSGNVVAGNTARINQTNYLGNVTPLSGITNMDVRWEFQGNSIIPDSVNEADTYLTGGAETIITGAAGDWQEIGVPVAVGVSWASDVASRFTVGNDGVITYIGERDICERVTGRATVEKSGGGADVIEVRLAKNWDGTVTDSGIEKSRAQTQNTAPTTVPIGALVELTNGDNLRIIFSNMTSTSNIIANVSAFEIA